METAKIAKTIVTMLEEVEHLSLNENYNQTVLKPQ